MTMFRIVFDLFLVAVLGYIGVTFYLQYREEQVGTVWQKSLAAAKDSATILVVKVGAVCGTLIGMIGDLGDLFNRPQIREYAEAALGSPEVVSGVLLAFSLIVFFARTRKSSSDPV